MKTLKLSILISVLFLISGCDVSDDGGSEKGPNAGNLTSYQWHLENEGQSAFASETGTIGEDINQQTAYSEGISGNTVIVAVVDTGLEIAHSDLSSNVISGESWDFWNLDSDPTNNYNSDGDHGTSVAGIIAAKDNGIGGRGVAPGVSLKGFSYILSNQSISEHIDALGGSSISPKSDDVDIFNMSYGTSNTDDSTINSTLRSHLEWAADNSRAGKGAIYVKSAGNGFEDFGNNNSADCAKANDAGISCQNVNMDAIAATPWIINVGALNADGERSSYSTGGSGIWISAPGGEYGYDQTYGWSASNPVKIFQPAIITTDQSGCSKGYSSTVNGSPPNRFEDNSNSLNDGCNFTSTFNGTSSAAPVISGGIALILEANSNLTWRDVKHILANTSRKVDSSHAGISISINGGNYDANLGWVTNDASYDYHNWYGFGALDIDAAVAMAKTYVSSLGTFTTKDNSADSLSISIADEDASGNTDSLTIAAITVEVVEITISISHPDIGEVAIELQSPASTKSILLTMYNGFSNSDDLAEMVLLSNAFYGESGAGSWTIKVIDGVFGNTGTLTSWKLKIYGH